PVKPSELTRAYFAGAAAGAAGEMSADMKRVSAGTADAAVYRRLSREPLYNSILRTTCVATQLSGGHAENALPQTARAVVNCRMLPVDKADEIEKMLTRVIADPKVNLEVMTPAKPVDYKPMSPDVMAAVSAASARLW